LVFDRLESIGLGPVWGSCREYILTHVTPRPDPNSSPQDLPSLLITTTLSCDHPSWQHLLSRHVLRHTPSWPSTTSSMTSRNGPSLRWPRRTFNLVELYLIVSRTHSLCANTNLVQPRNTHTVARRSMGFQEVKSVTSKYQHLATPIISTKTHHQALSEVLVQDSTPLPITVS
jgi:hypothetical protein